ncbi:uncharacterized protein LOC124665609 [Lolium rigidum]|uniref:uncharacterized protein LOC124665609 n=1 Tax=Lolium rigidum TaxID=89674 RepID=UPI001F5DE35E|nr:uncharacterized protein LOC124665609 [Lolium rigidum]
MPADSEPEGVISLLRTQAKVDAVCKKYGVPKDEYTARPAGDLRASSRPPPGAVCVYEHALEAGMRVPLHGFFSEALAHFGLAPAQVVPNGWRIMAGFVVLCHYAGVPPSLRVFRHFYGLRILNRKEKGGWYGFLSKDTSGLHFTGLPDSIKGWKDNFFFLSSSTPWPCPVQWGEPSKSSNTVPVLTGEEKRSAAVLLRAHGGAPVDIRTYLSDNSLAAAKISLASPAPTPPSCTPTSGGSKSKGIYPSVYDMMKNIQAEKAAAAQASASANKRRLDEADGKEVKGRPPSVVAVNTPPPAHRPPAGEPSDVASPSFVGIFKATNNMISSLEEQLEQAKGEVTAVKAELAASKRAAAVEREKAKAELAAAKRAAEAELEKVKAELAAAKKAAKAERERGDAERATVQQLLAGLERLKTTTSAARRT